MYSAVCVKQEVPDDGVANAASVGFASAQILQDQVARADSNNSGDVNVRPPSVNDSNNQIFDDYVKMEVMEEWMDAKKKSTWIGTPERLKVETQDQDDDNECDSRADCPSGPAEEEEEESFLKKKKGGSFKCTYCGEFRSSKQSLQRHMRTHTGERPFKCDHCDKAFTLKCVLREHLATHTNEKTFSCTLCDHVTHSRLTLYAHKRTHFSGPHFVCAQCGEGFHCRDPYRKHVETKHSAKGFTCDHCGFETKRSDKFREHTKLKAIGRCNEAHFTCDHCGYKTRSLTALKHHRRERQKSGQCSSGKPGPPMKPRYKCAHCEYLTMQQDEMDQHHKRRRASEGKCPSSKLRGIRLQRCFAPGRPEIVVHDAVSEVNPKSEPKPEPNH